MKRKVKIKTWERMEEEFGLNTLRSIDCKYKFTTEMERLMPNSRIIEIDNHKWVTEERTFYISKDMIDDSFILFSKNITII